MAEEALFLWCGAILMVIAIWCGAIQKILTDQLNFHQVEGGSNND